MQQALTEASPSKTESPFLGRSEKMVMAEAQKAVCIEILTPLQAAQAALASMPQPVDCLHLCSLATSRGGP